ncbi:MAG TPA: hypothetical protein VFQ61_02830, partial [Polyangiaceae bacterium]|nr:hypothetical protein [Polyangiaceae bacterium]
MSGVVCSIGSGPALAQTPPGPGECVDSNTAAQSLVREGKFGAAREQLKRCLEPACPGLVRDDCAQRLDALDRVQPTVVFEVKDEQGRDLAEVTIQVDGQL